MEDTAGMNNGFCETDDERGTAVTVPSPSSMGRVVAYLSKAYMIVASPVFATILRILMYARE